MQNFRDLIFYQVYKLLYTDVYSFLLFNSENILDRILENGLVALEVRDLEKIKADSRVRFLDRYFAELSNRPSVDLVNHFFEMLCNIKWTYLSTPSTMHEELGHLYLEQRASKGKAILCRENLDAFGLVRLNFHACNIIDENPKI